MLKDIKEFSAEEVGLWLAAQGLGDHAAKFVGEGVDGDLLLSLSYDDLKADLGLSSLQSKKVLKNIEFSKGLTAGGGGGGEDVEQLKSEIAKLTSERGDLEAKVRELKDALSAKDAEVSALNKDMEALTVKAVPEAPAPAPKPAPAPAPQSHHHHQQRQPGVVGGAARGAAGGALKGAIGE